MPGSKWLILGWLEETRWARELGFVGKGVSFCTPQSGTIRLQSPMYSATEADLKGHNLILQGGGPAPTDCYCTAKLVLAAVVGLVPVETGDAVA